MRCLWDGIIGMKRGQGMSQPAEVVHAYARKSSLVLSEWHRPLPDTGTNDKSGCLRGMSVCRAQQRPRRLPTEPARLDLDHCTCFRNRRALQTRGFGIGWCTESTPPCRHTLLEDASQTLEYD